MRHAMDVIWAYAQGSYSRFFRLYNTAPHMYVSGENASHPEAA